MDDLTLAGECNAVTADVRTITNASKETGLHLNPTKCDITADNFNQISHPNIFKDIKRVAKEDITLLGEPILIGPAVDHALLNKVDELNTAEERLTKILDQFDQSLQDGLTNIPDKFYQSFRDGLTKIRNIDLDDNKWRQVNHPLRLGGLRIRSAKTLASSTFFVSVASTRTLEILYFHNCFGT